MPKGDDFFRTAFSIGREAHITRGATRDYAPPSRQDRVDSERILQRWLQCGGGDRRTPHRTPFDPEKE